MSDEAAAAVSIEAMDATITEVLGDSTLAEPAEPAEPAFDASSAFAAISRKEKAIREREDAIKDKESKYSKYQDIDTLSMVEKAQRFGINLDDLILESLGEDKPDPTTEDRVSELQKQIDDMKQAKLDEAAKAEEDEKVAQSTLNERAIKAHQDQIATYIEENADKYEIITQQGAQEMVWQVTEEHFRTHNEILTIEQAADKVEDFYYKQAVELQKLNKFKPKVEERSEIKEAEVKETLTDRYETGRSARPTLTQNYITANPTIKAQDNQNLTADQRKAETVKRLEEMYKQTSN